MDESIIQPQFHQEAEGYQDLTKQWAAWCEQQIPGEYLIGSMEHWSPTDFPLAKNRAVSCEMLVTQDATNHPILPLYNDKNTCIGDMGLLLKKYFNELWGESCVISQSDSIKS